MTKALVSIGVVLCLASAGFALADVTVSGPSGGTVTIGQSLVIAVNDSLDGASPGHPPYYCFDPSSVAAATGRFSVGPLGPAEGGTGWIALSVSCTNPATWNYSGSVTLTVPADAGTSEWISVAVAETLPFNSYNFNQTYPVASPTASSTGSTASTTVGTTAAGATTTVPASTVTATVPATPQPTTSKTVTATTTVVQTSTITVSTNAPAAPVTYAINVPSTITIRQTGRFIYITITSNDRRSLQTLCWSADARARLNCASRRGAWRVKLQRKAGTRIFLLKQNGKVVARKSVRISLKP